MVRKIIESKKAGKEEYHWADGVADQLLKQKSKSSQYTCAAGIATSGVVHIGRFREIITVDIISRAIREKGKKARFILSWDDFDRLRKIPSNLPKSEQPELEKHLFKPVSAVPDPYKCHKSYAEHFEKEFEESAVGLGINPEYIFQSKKYQNCEYANEIKFILKNREKIKFILNKYKTGEKISAEWWPVQIYCEKCGKDTTKILRWDDKFLLEYECECGYKGKVDFSKKGIVKLPWRIDWPMRWHYEQVDFEPGGKEHSTPGGSRDTAKEIVEQVYGEKAPLYLMYDYIILKEVGGKMSSSLGNVITPAEALKIYESQILRYLFVKARPNTEFAIAFDKDVLKTYAEYDELEDAYFNKKLDKKQQRIYELSQVSAEKPKRIFAPYFRQLVELVQARGTQGIIDFYKQDIKTKEDEARVRARIELARNWLKHAPEEFSFKIKDKIDRETLKKLSKKEASALKELAKILNREISEQELAESFRDISKQMQISPKDFFRAAYLALLGKEQGPRLSSLIVLEKEKVLKLLKSI